LLILVWSLTPSFADIPAAPGEAGQTHEEAKKETANTLIKKGKYLAAFTMLLNEYEQLPLSQKDREKRTMLISQISQLCPILGNVNGALSWEDKSGRPGPSGIASQLPAHHPLDRTLRRNALDAIVEAARSRQIVILNEAHNLSQNRAFGMQVALALRKLHFNYFAAETFSPGIVEAADKGYMARSMGWYTDDPVFGDLVRQVLRAGYKLVPYEWDWEKPKGDSWDQINVRETQQAQHIVDRILKKDPGARILIYAGYAHATKDWKILPDGREVGWMAARLKRQTGIDPLTIDQTEMTEHSTAVFEKEAYRYADSKGWLDTPVIFEEAPGHYWVGGRYAGKVDMQIFHPRTKLLLGRPDWMTMSEYRKPFPIRETWRPSTGSGLLQAFVATEPDDAIAMDQIVITGSDGADCLLLPVGKYRIVLQDAEGNSRQVDTITQP